MRPYSPTFMRMIASEVARAAGIGERDLYSKSRRRPVAHARQDAWLRIYDETFAPMAAIGKLFDRDPSTVSVGIETARRRM